MVMPHAYDTMEDDTTNNEGDRSAVAQSVEHLSLVQLYWRGFESQERHLSL